MAAAYNGHKATVEFLLSQPDIDVNAVDAEGETAYMKAVKKASELKPEEGTNKTASNAEHFKQYSNQLEICRLFTQRKSYDLTQKNTQLGVGITVYASDQPTLMRDIAKAAHQRMKSAKNMGQHGRFKSLHNNLRTHGQNPSISDSQQLVTVVTSEGCCS